MLARSGRLPTPGEWAYEVKWDGFRAIVSTERELRVRSRRGWNMTPHVGFLAALPVRALSPKNLWPEPWARARRDDHGIEASLHAQVCDGTLKLWKARALEIAYKHAHG
jgi:hypothetical protein